MSDKDDDMDKGVLDVVRDDGEEVDARRVRGWMRRRLMTDDGVHGRFAGMCRVT